MIFIEIYQRGGVDALILAIREYPKKPTLIADLMSRKNRYKRSVLNYLAEYDAESYLKVIALLPVNERARVVENDGHHLLASVMLDQLATQLRRLLALLPENDQNRVLGKILSPLLHEKIRNNDLASLQSLISLIPAEHRLAALTYVHPVFKRSATAAVKESFQDKMGIVEAILISLPDQDRLTFVNETEILHFMSKLSSPAVSSKNDDEWSIFSFWRAKRIQPCDDDVDLLKNLLCHLPEKDRRPALMFKDSNGYSALALLYGRTSSPLYDRRGRQIANQWELHKSVPRGHSVMKDFLQESEVVAELENYCLQFNACQKESILAELSRELKRHQGNHTELSSALRAWKQYDPKSKNSFPLIPADFQQANDRLNLTARKIVLMQQISEALRQARGMPADKFDNFAKSFNQSLAILAQDADKPSIKILKAIAHLLASVISLGAYPAIRSLHSMATRGSAKFWQPDDAVQLGKIKGILHHHPSSKSRHRQ